jgi:hypothetical protein
MFSGASPVFYMTASTLFACTLMCMCYSTSAPWLMA